MSTQLSKAQIEAIRVELAKVGLNVTVKRQTKVADKPKNVQDVLSKSKWYKRPSLSTASCTTTARYLAESTWENMRTNPAKYGLCFPHKEC